MIFKESKSPSSESKSLSVSEEKSVLNEPSENVAEKLDVEHGLSALEPTPKEEKEKVAA